MIDKVKELYAKNPSIAYVQRELDIGYETARELVESIKDEMATEEECQPTNEIINLLDEICMVCKDGGKVRIYKSFDEIQGFCTPTILHIIHNDDLGMFELLEFQERLQDDNNEIYVNTHCDPKSDLKIIAISKE
ncbi:MULTISPECIES: hypothetical protein [unclassified Campylobacter]|uniref:hypothetical protein n=1 Tax=unclassified Campylobacter TaxID=2593542 RepID=UPI001DE2F7AE|nr:hypothetical protein [Campylobacter sp. RM12647]MBZ7993294.1 hypothetical protein [Campylobacter sp. RM9333]